MILNNIKSVMESYKPDEGIWREYSDDTLLLMRAMDNLEDSDRIIFVLYCEYGSLRKVAKKIGVSHSIIYKNIIRIKQRLYDYIRANSDNSNSGLLDRFKWVTGISEEGNMEVVEGE